MYPEVDRINVLPISQTLLFDYVVVSKRYFNSRQKRALQEKVKGALATVASTVEVRTVRSPHPEEHTIAVTARPADSVAGPGSYVVLKTLQAELAPLRPLTSVGYWLVKAPVPSGMYAMWLKILGNPDDSTLHELQGKLEQLQCVHQLTPPPVQDATMHFLLVIHGSPLASVDPKSPSGYREDDFRRELRELGVSLGVTPNDRQTKMEWRG